MSENDAIERPWRREPYVWMVIAFPAAAVIGGIVTIWLAIVSDDGLVVDDYYKRGLEINRLLDRERRAANAGLAMMIELDPESHSMLLTLQAEPGFVYPSRIDGAITHATRAGLDQDLQLQRVGDDMYRATNVTLPPGRWYVDIGTAEWRLTERITSS